MRILIHLFFCWCCLYGFAQIDPIKNPSRKSGLTSPSTRVLWDISHGILADNHPQVRYSDFLQVLETSGRVVDVDDSGILSLDLDTYDILIIDIFTSWDFAYSPTEVERIQRFVNHGGALFLISDVGTAPLEHIAPVANLYGVDLLDVFINVSEIDTFADHPVFTGVSLLQFSASGAVEVQLPMIVGAWAPSGEVVISYGQFGGGIVAVLADSSALGNEFFSAADNERFAENLFDYLIAARVPVLSEGFLLLLVILMALAAGVLGGRRAVKWGS